MPFLAIIFCLLAAPSWAQTVVASHTIRANTVLASGDLTVVGKTIPGALQDIETAIGREARVVLYAGRPIRADQLGAPALVDRNDIVSLVFRRGGLAISTEGRALDRGGLKDRIKVMNLGSRSIVEGEVIAPSTVLVRPLGE